MEKIKIYSWAALASVILLVGGWLLLSKARLETRVAVLEGQLALCQTINREWEAKSAEAKAAVGRLVAEGEKRRQISEAARQRVSPAVRRHKDYAGRLLIPAAGGAEECLAARQLLDSYRQEGGRP